MNMHLLQISSPSVITMLVQAIIAIAGPMAATYIVMQLSKLTKTVDRMPDWEKRILVVVYSVVIIGISHAMGLKLPDAWGAMGTADVQALLTACGAFIIHRIVHPKTGVP